MTAAMQTGNTGGIFKDTTTRAWLCIDDFANLPLTDHGRGACAGGGIGKQKLDIAGADFAPIQPIGRAFFALDPAGDLEKLGVIIGGGGFAVVIVDGERHLSHIAGRSACRAIENDVIHARGAQAFV